MSIMSTLEADESKAVRGARLWHQDCRIWSEIRGQWSVRVPTAGLLPLRGDALLELAARNGVSVSPEAKAVFAHPRFGEVTPENKEMMGRWFHHDLIVLPAVGMLENDRLDIDSVEAVADVLGFSLPFPEVCLPLRLLISDADLESLGFEWLLVLHKPLEDDPRKVPSILAIHRPVDGFDFQVHAHVYSRRLEVPKKCGLVLWNHPHGSEPV